MFMQMNFNEVASFLDEKCPEKLLTNHYMLNDLLEDVLVQVYKTSKGYIIVIGLEPIGKEKYDIEELDFRVCEWNGHILATGEEYDLLDAATDEERRLVCGAYTLLLRG